MLKIFHIGHTSLKHGCLLRGELAPFYFNHDIPLTVPHILFGCLCYGKACLAYNLHGMLSNMRDDCDSVSDVLAFLNAIELLTSV
jgi:hypothetical protein